MKLDDSCMHERMMIKLNLLFGLRKLQDSSLDSSHSSYGLMAAVAGSMIAYYLKFVLSQYRVIHYTEKKVIQIKSRQ
jgi:hypothetical protein